MIEEGNLVCRSCGGLIVRKSDNYVEGRQVCRQCLDRRKINEDAYLRTYHIRKSINEFNRIAKANI